MKLIDNINDLLGDDIKKSIQPDARLKIAASCNALAACFETGVSEEFVKLLAKRAPLRAVFRDAGFASDSVKINVEQIFKLMSPSTEVKAIWRVN
ncbi:MAG: hypothetical protein Q7T78_20485 [Rhodoferax sp.]|nr:hypothetical protein [Rhodoferax sp.]